MKPSRDLTEKRIGNSIIEFEKYCKKLNNNKIHEYNPVLLKNLKQIKEEYLSTNKKNLKKIDDSIDKAINDCEEQYISEMEDQISGIITDD